MQLPRMTLHTSHVTRHTSHVTRHTRRYVCTPGHDVCSSFMLYAVVGTVVALMRSDALHDAMQQQQQQQQQQPLLSFEICRPSPPIAAVGEREGGGGAYGVTHTVPHDAQVTPSPSYAQGPTPPCVALTCACAAAAACVVLYVCAAAAACVVLYVSHVTHSPAVPVHGSPCCCRHGHTHFFPAHPTGFCP